MKKVTIFLLIAFLFSSVYANDLSDRIESDNKIWTDAALFLAEKGFIENFNPEPEWYRLTETITRKEMMKVVMKMSGKKVIDYCRGEFLDVVDDWGCKYIEAGLDARFIAKNEKFRPDDNITKTEAMKLILRSKQVRKIGTTEIWQQEYMETAYLYGIIDEKYFDYNSDATRVWIFEAAAALIELENEIARRGGIISDESL